MDGALPPEQDPTYKQATAPYKFLGTVGNITGPAIAGGRSYTDLEAEIAEAALRRIIQGEEFAILYADPAINPIAFSGETVQLVTNVINFNGNPLTASGVSIPALDKMIKLIRLQGGNKLDMIACSFGVQGIINEIVGAVGRYYVRPDESTGKFTAGDNIVAYNSPLGPVPIVGD